MLVCVTATGRDLDSTVDPRFGRAANFIIYETDTGKYDVIENKQRMDLPQGAGIQSATTIVDSGAKVVLTGNCGPKAFRVLNSCEVDVYVGLGGMTVREALEKFQAGQLQPIAEANVEGRWM
jgi:predicted Fe-Mo cluster-binding NifX family protein